LLKGGSCGRDLVKRGPDTFQKRLTTSIFEKVFSRLGKETSKKTGGDTSKVVGDAKDNFGRGKNQRKKTKWVVGGLCRGGGLFVVKEGQMGGTPASAWVVRGWGRGGCKRQTSAKMWGALGGRGGG